MTIFLLSSPEVINIWHMSCVIWTVWYLGYKLSISVSTICIKLLIFEYFVIRELFLNYWSDCWKRCKFQNFDFFLFKTISRVCNIKKLLSRRFSFVGRWHWVPWNRYCVNTANWSRSFAASSWTGRRADVWNRVVSWRSEFLAATWVSICSIRAKTCLRCCAAAPNLLRLMGSWMEFTGPFQSALELVEKNWFI